MSSFGINVMDFGAKGDGVTDDTAAIQAAINFAAACGGGKILFPYTQGGYRIASPAIEEIDGRPVRAQLVIPAGHANIQPEGEMPCRMLNAYMVRPLESVKHNYVPTTHANLFGMPKGPCNVIVDSVNFECGTGLRPQVSQLKYSVCDEDNRLHGSLGRHKPWGKQEFPVCGAADFAVRQL